jgi:putative tryptophan/tyrosine transport system substrate-binding protein
MRRRFLALLGGLLIGPGPLAAQSRERIPYIGYMSPGDVPRYDIAFLQGLQDEGYILPDEIPRYDAAFWRSLVKRGSFSGKRIRIEIRSSAENFPRSAAALAADLVQKKVNLLYTATPPEAEAARRAAQRANRTIPIVFGPSADPVGGGLVASLARPGGDVTGMLWGEPELEAKRFEILLEAFPKVSRVTYLHEPYALPPALGLRARQAVEAAARTANVTLDIVEVREPGQIDTALERISAFRAQGMLVQLSPVLLGVRQRIVDYAAHRHVLTIYGDALFVEEGGLMFYGTPYTDLVRRAANVVGKVLKGAKPSDIPVEGPTQFKLLINSGTAKALGVSIPESILVRAESIDTARP